MTNNSMYYSLKVGAIIAKFIPRKVGLKISYSLGVFWGRMPTKSLLKRMIVQNTLTPHLNTRQTKKAAAQVLGHYAQYWWDVFWMSSNRTIEEIEEIVRIEGRDYFDKAIELGKSKGTGVIVALPHMGSWEIPGAYLSKIGYPPVVVAERLKPPALFELFTRTRTRAGMTVIAHDDSPSSKLLEALKSQKMVCLVADRDLSKKGLNVKFFSKTKTMPAGPASLAVKTGAPIIPTCMYMTHSGDIEASFFPPILVEDFNDEDKTQRLQDITQTLASSFEKMIAKAPTQWHILKSEWQEDARQN